MEVVEAREEGKTPNTTSEGTRHSAAIVSFIASIDSRKLHSTSLSECELVDYGTSFLQWVMISFSLSNGVMIIDSAKLKMYAYFLGTFSKLRGSQDRGEARIVP